MLPTDNAASEQSSRENPSATQGSGETPGADESAPAAAATEMTPGGLGDASQSLEEGNATIDTALEAGIAESDDDEEREISEEAAMWGAAGAGGGVGFLFGGGILAALGAVGGAYAASRSGTVGEAARNSGKAVVKLGRKAKSFNKKHKVAEKAKTAAVSAFDRAKEINERHQIAEKAKTAAVSAFDRAKEINERHQISTRTWNAVKGGLEKAKEFDEKHQITSKVVVGVGTGLTKLEHALTSRPGAAHVEEVEDAVVAGSPAVVTGVPVADSSSSPAAPVDATPTATAPQFESHV
mmetsp:Transcript_9867/g.19718  ORF Transcript_9867/g.19718 Transcript_9867/m.19718 type:complete len:296 (-) Transcript_9867:80-967(-)|eukprot:CAMPEP_0181326828 /NCGR_PEP_ID=MMETSP1101-20121128/21732_1 /TAXON_ID=46948 /ORGANISM="Rhodomonas abbreviata, Strain Caron Lab Isolate" /LENGTH=295 /DNA_ID=CAMNT_0023435359 /DNA_START=50 /DNA_END=937 /DNA_ORIENTATION=+